MNRLPVDELVLHVPYLVRHSLYAPVLWQWLVQQCTVHEQVAMETFWELQNYIGEGSLQGRPPPPKASAPCRKAPSVLVLLQSDYRYFFWRTLKGAAFCEHAQGTNEKGLDQHAIYTLNTVTGHVSRHKRNSIAAGPAAGRAGGHISQVAQEALATWRQHVPPSTRDKVSSAAHFVETVRSAYHGPLGPEGVAHKFATLQKQSFHLPLQLHNDKDGGGSGGGNHGPLYVDYRHVKTMNSFTSPVVIPCCMLSSSPLGAVLFKPCDVRKEQIIMNTIRMISIMLRDDEGLDLPIETYPIRPTSATDGFIAMVPDCVSLQGLRSQRTGILPWLIEQNEQSSESAAALRERFLQSCAAYCVISYLLGIGDRNLHNLLLRPNGSLFHIDFGFVLGQDPKPLEKPQMRITPEMLEALGGSNSEAYRRFCQLSSRIYNCIRRHVNLFVVMLRLLIEAHPVIEENGIISESDLMREVRRRFVPGENYKEAEILIQTHIEQSTTNTFTYSLIDKLHEWATNMRGGTSGGADHHGRDSHEHSTQEPDEQLKKSVESAHFIFGALWPK